MGDAEKYERESTTGFFDGAFFSFFIFLFSFCTAGHVVWVFNSLKFTFSTT